MKFTISQPAPPHSRFAADPFKGNLGSTGWAAPVSVIGSTSAR